MDLNNKAFHRYLLWQQILEVNRRMKSLKAIENFFFENILDFINFFYQFIIMLFIPAEVTIFFLTLEHCANWRKVQ